MSEFIYYTWGGQFQFNFDFEPALLGGQTVGSVAATHVPPSGGTVTPTVIHTPPASVGAVIVPALSVAGTHQIRVVATLASPAANAAVLTLIVVQA